MRKKTFKNSDVSEILNIAPRRILNVTEKGLVIPVVDASGAGSKREYDYTNLLEFGLIENLFKIGLGIHLVKKIVSDLREAGDFKDWAEDFDTFYLKSAEKYLLWVKEHQKKNQHFDFSPLYDPEKTNDPALVKNNLKPKKPHGFLFYTFKEDGFNKKRIVSGEIKPSWEDSNFFSAGFLFEDIVLSRAMLIVNLGEIKEKIDTKIEAIN